MTWSYSGDPGASSLDAMRFLLGDTSETTAVFTDEELTWLLTQNSNIYFAAAQAAESAATSASQAITSGTGGVKTKTVGALSITFSDAAEAEKFASNYRAVAHSLRIRGAINSTIMPYSGGISKADKLATEADPDWDRGAFSRGMHDYPGSDLKRGERIDTR